MERGIFEHGTELDVKTEIMKQAFAAARCKGRKKLVYNALVPFCCDDCSERNTVLPGGKELAGSSPLWVVDTAGLGLQPAV